MTERKTYKITFWFLALVLAVLPFWSAFIEFLTQRTGLSGQQIFMIRAWYEPVLVLIFLATVFNPKWERRELKLNIFDYLIIGYLIWAVASIFISGETISQGIQGLRYNGLFLGFYVLARFSFFSEAKILILQKIVITGGEIVAALAVLESFLLGPDWWQRFGILPLTSTFGFGATHQVVSVPQAMATLEGPNQLGSFLLLPLFLLLANRQKRKFDWFWIVVMMIAIVLSFSRSAILGMIVGLIVYSVFEILDSRRPQNSEPKAMAASKIWSKIGLLAGLVTIIAGSIWYFNLKGGLSRDFFSHGLSNQEHYFSMYASATADRSPKEFVVGQGIGTAGPASFNFAPEVPESWYLQVSLELGIVGLLLWLGILVFGVKRLFRSYRGLALVLISISVAALFLHTWADNPTVAISFWVLMGVIVGNFKPKD